MARIVSIPGCGRMACAGYAEIAAAIDRAYAVPPDQPLQPGEVWAAIAAEAGRSPSSNRPQRERREPDQGPAPGFG